MKIKTMTWNIGGAKMLEPGTDPNHMASYNVDALDYIAEIIKLESPDIIALQEVHKSDACDQAKILAEKLGLEYYNQHSFSWSHKDEKSMLGNAIISKYPITHYEFNNFINPNIEITWEDGVARRVHDKGFLQCNIDIDCIEISVVTLHITPFRKIGIELDAPIAIDILNDISSKIIANTDEKMLIMGDFNINDSTVASYFPDFAKHNIIDIETTEPTTPKDRRYDHVLYRNIKFISQTIKSDVKTDHYPVITEFRI